MHLNRQSFIVSLIFLIFIINISIFLKAQSFDHDDASVYVPQQSELPPGWTINQQSRLLTKGYRTPERFKKFQQVWRQQGRQIQSQMSSLPKQQRQMFEMIKAIAEKLEDMEKRANDIKSQFHYQLQIKTGEKVIVYNRSIDAVFLMAVNAMVISTASNAGDWWEFYSDLNREQMGNAAEMMKSLVRGLNPDFAVNSLSGWGDEALETRFGFDVDESRLSPAERNQIAAMKSQMAAVDTYGMVVRVGRVVFQVITSGAGKMQTKQRVTREMMELILRQKKGAMEDNDTGAGQGPLSPIIIALLAAVGLGGVGYGGAKLVKFLSSQASAPTAKPKLQPKPSESSPAPGPQLQFDIPDTAEPPVQPGPQLRFEEPVEPIEPVLPPGPALHFEDLEPSELQQEVPGKKIEKEKAKEEEEKEKEQKKPVRLILSSSVEEIESNGKDRVELTVKVLDRELLPLPGQAVEFETLDGGTLTPMGTNTGPGGTVKAMWLPEANTRETCRLGAFCRDYPDIHDRIFVHVKLIQPVYIKLTAAPDRLPADGKTQTDILAVVTGKNGEPIPDAHVEFSTGQPRSHKDLRKRSDRTGADGTAKNQFTIDEDVQGDSVEIIAAIKFFDSKKLHPPLEGRCKITVTTNLVEGTVKDQQGNPLEGVKVYLENITEDWNTREKTGPGGEFRFEDWDPGKYEIRAQKTGYDESEKSTGDFFLERSGKVHIDLELIEQLTLELDIEPETLEADGKDRSKITVKLQGAEKRPVEGESIQAKVEGENSGQLDRESTSTNPEGIALFTYTASETGGEFNIRVWPDSRPSLEKTGTIKQEAFPYFDVDFADRIIRVYMKEGAEARTRGLTTADLEKVRVLRTDRETPFPGTIGSDRFLVAAVYATFGFKQGDRFYQEQVEHCRQLQESSKNLSARLEKQRYDADWYNAMTKGMIDFKQYYDTVVLFINPPDPAGAAKTILKGGAKGLLTVCDLLLGVYSDIDKAEARGEGWFSGKEWLDKDYCMEKMRENLTGQIEALDKLTEAAGELEKSWQQTQPGSDAPQFRIREVIPLETRSQAYQVLHWMWKFLIEERRRLFHWAQWKRMESPPQLEIAGATLEIHEGYMEEQRAGARKVEAMAESMKSMAA